MPRKLIRAVELLELQMEAARERGWRDFDVLTLARLTLLQLFAPALYRHARKHYPGLLTLLHEWAQGHDGHWQRDDFAETLKAGLADAKQADRNTFDRHHRPILALICEARASRTGFEPTNVVRFGPESDSRNPRAISAGRRGLPLHQRRRRTAPRRTDHRHRAFLELLFSDSEATGSPRSACRNYRAQCSATRTSNACSIDCLTRTAKASRPTLNGSANSPTTFPPANCNGFIGRPAC
ncbi:MAG: hypothetical protein H6926_03515 [Chromatiales bacterium]|nr:hypothetical protein [Chromatiales bacterium]